MIGTLVNTGAIIAGAFIGLLLRKGISKDVQTTVMQGLSLAVLVIGIQMSLKTQNPLVIIGSLVLGGVLGEWIGIEDKLNKFGKWLESKVGQNQGQVGKAFVTTSLIYCVGAMAIMGSIEEGLTGKADTLFAKSMLDGISAIVFSSTMGIGVAFSAIPVFIYQGTITLAAGFFAKLLSPDMIAEMTATGGLLIIGIGINMLGLAIVRVGNLLPGVFLAIALTYLAQLAGIY